MNDELQLRKPPYSLEAEQSVLGGLMISPELTDKVRLSEREFYREAHRVIFRAIRDLLDQGQYPDVVTLGEWLETKGLGEAVGGIGYVASLANNTPGVANINAYAGIVRDKARLREVLEICNKTAGMVYDGQRSDQIIEQALRTLQEFRKPNQVHSVSIREAMGMALERIDRAAELRRTGQIVGVSTGISKLDDYTGGWQNQDLIVIGARPSVGKTALLCNLVISAKVSAGLISAEQGAVQIAMRHIAQRGKIPLQEMKRGSLTEVDYAALAGEPVRQLAAAPYWIWDRPAPTIDEVVAQARQWKLDHDIKLLGVDYIQRLRSPGHDSKAYEVNNICQRLKELGRELDIPVLALSQVNRSVDGKGPRYVPQLNDLSDGSGIEKEADAVIMLTRPEMADKSIDPGMATMTIRKHRDGELAQLKTAFLGPFVSFEDLSPHHHEVPPRMHAHGF